MDREKQNDNYILNDPGIYRRFVECIEDIIFLIDSEGYFIYISPAVENMTGYKPSQVTGKHFSLFINDDSLLEPALCRRQTFDKKIKPTELCWLKRNGEKLHCRISGNPLVINNRFVGLTGIIIDITEKKSIEQALKISKENFVKAFRYSPNIQILTRMRDKSIIDVSNSFFEYSGYSKNDVIGKTTAELSCWVNDNDRDIIWKLLKNSGVVKNKEFKMKDRNGFIHDICLSSEIIYIDKELYITSTLFNLTEVRKLEKMIIELSEKEKYRITYEIDNNLANFLSGISILCRNLKRKLDEKYFDEANLAYEISNLIDEAVSQIRELSRGFDPVKPGDSCIMDSMENLVSSIRNVSGINCIVSKGNQLPQIDRTMARNILRIAREAINRAIKLRNPSNIMLILDYEENRIKLIVRDDGIMANDVKDDRNYIILKHIAGLLNGTLDFEYEGNVNSLICLVNCNEYNANGYDENKENDIVIKSRILVVDDLLLVRRGLMKIIEETSGWEICGEADNYANMVKAVRRLKPDLLVCDFVLDGIYNLDLCRSLLSVNPSLLILVISNQDELIYAERLIKAGARGYIMKTETQEKITDAVYTVLKGEIYVSRKFSASIASNIQSPNYSQQNFIINTLSERELEVFTMIGKGLHSKEIAAKLFINIKTVEAIRKRLRIKLEILDSKNLLKLAINWVNHLDHEGTSR